MSHRAVVRQNSRRKPMRHDDPRNIRMRTRENDAPPLRSIPEPIQFTVALDAPIPMAELIQPRLNYPDPNVPGVPLAPILKVLKDHIETAVTLCDVVDAADGPEGQWPYQEVENGVALIRRLARGCETSK